MPVFAAPPGRGAAKGVIVVPSPTACQDVAEGAALLSTRTCTSAWCSHGVGLLRGQDGPTVSICSLPPEVTLAAAAAGPTIHELPDEATSTGPAQGAAPMTRRGRGSLGLRR